MNDFSGVMAGADTSSSAGSPPAEVSEGAGASAPLAESSASTTALPAETGTTAQVVNPVEGQTIPYPRFREVNEERSRYKADLERLSWATTIPDGAGTHMARLYESLAADPIGTLIRESEALAQSDPQHAQALRSAAARWLGEGRGQGRIAADAMPEPDLQAADGTLVYSAPQAQKLMEWQQTRAEQKFTQQLQPIQQFVQKAHADQMRAEIQANAQTYASQTYAQWSQRPHFVEHKAQIADYMEQHPTEGIADAYAHVLTTHVLPRLSATERSTVVAAMHQKAAAGTTNPSRGPAQGIPRAKSFGEAARLLTQAG